MTKGESKKYSYGMDRLYKFAKIKISKILCQNPNTPISSTRLCLQPHIIGHLTPPTPPLILRKFWISNPTHLFGPFPFYNLKTFS